MSQPNSGEYSARSLAEILREHGLETELGTRPGRRRRTSDDVEVTGRSPRVDAAPRPQAPGQPTPGARAPSPVRAPGSVPAAVRTPPAASPAAARTPVTTWPEPSASARPAAGLAGPGAPAPARVPAAARAEPAVREPRSSPEDGLSTPGRGGQRVDVAQPPVRGGRRASDVAAPPTTAPPKTALPETGLFGTGPTTSAIPAVTGATTTTNSRVDAHPVTGPIPVQRAEAADVEDDEPLTGRQSALAWVRFFGELVVALAVGIGLYFAFTVLWELMPYVALVAAPVAVTALVTGVAAWRRRRGQGELGVRLLGVLTLAGTVLVIAPAAGLLAG
jgi:hypothetical protein